MSNLFNSTGYAVYEEDMVSGSGCYVFDRKGKKYLDMEAGVWALPLGHCDPDINKAIHNQIDKMMHCGYKYNTEIAEKCARKLLQITEMEGGKCVFLTSGSEAVEYGIQLAKAIRPGKKCVSLKNQYLSAYGSGMTKDEPEWMTIEWDNRDEQEKDGKTYEKKSKDTYCNEIVSAMDFSQIGVFVFEAGNSSGLVKFPPKNLVQAIVELARENDAVIVGDEVTCGIGRTGKWFGYMYYDMKPDIIAAGKGLGNGYPVSAVILKENMASEAEKAGFHFGQSHQNDPLGCRGAYEVLSKIEQSHILESSCEIADYFMNQYKKMQQEIPCISEVRGRGLLLCIELSNSITAQKMMEIEKQLFEQSYIVAVKPKERVIRTYCPLIITKEMVDSYLTALKKCFQTGSLCSI